MKYTVLCHQQMVGTVSERDYIMLSDLASSAKHPEVKGQQKIEKDGEL